MGEYNVILTAMSTYNFTPALNYYYYCENDKLYICSGVSQLEAGTKYFLSKKKIDKIIAVQTEETATKTKAFQYRYKKDEFENGNVTSNVFYQNRIKQFLEGNDVINFQIEDIEEFYPKAPEGGKECKFERKQMVPLEENRYHDGLIQFVDTERIYYGQKIENIRGIVEAIYKDKKEADELNIFIDMQGGARTWGFVRNAVVSILSNEKDARVSIEEIIATDFDSSEKLEMGKLVSEKKRYQITDLVAAMNSFVRYGKSDLLLKYCKERGVDTKNRVPSNADLIDLLKSIERIDDAISLCNTNELVLAIKCLRDSFDKIEKNKTKGIVVNSKDEGFIRTILEVLVDGIRRDYGELLNENSVTSDRFIVELIDWCTRKGFIQQALTLVEDKMPGVFLKKENLSDDSFKYILSYASGLNDSELKKKAENIGQHYYSVENNLFNRLSDNSHCKWSDSIEYNILEKAGMQIEMPVITGEEIDKSNYNLIYLSSGRRTFERIHERKIIDLKEELEELLDNKEIDWQVFVDKYCEYRSKEPDTECNKANWNNPERIYDYMRNNISDNIYVKRSIVHFADGMEKEYQRIQKKQPWNSNSSYLIKDSFKVTLRLNELCKDEDIKLDYLIRLHKALKLERNCANHASTKGIRLSAKVIKKMLEIYTGGIRSILDKLE